MSTVGARAAEPEPEPEPLDLPLVFSDVAIRGWRAWELEDFETRQGTEPRLASVAGYGKWHPGTSEARCGDSDGHAAPWPDCDCGFWVMRTRADAERTANEYANVGAVGEVEIKGRVVEHERGWRAQYATPLRLFTRGIGEDLQKELARIYDVPVEELPEPEPGPMSNPRGGLTIRINTRRMVGSLKRLQRVMSAPPLPTPWLSTAQVRAAFDLSALLPEPASDLLPEPGEFLDRILEDANWPSPEPWQEDLLRLFWQGSPGVTIVSALRSPY